jgi:stage II sporulation protein M
MKWMDKLKGTIKVNKKTLLFFTILLIIGIIAGSIFMAILSETDKKLVTDYFNNYISNIENNKLNYLESIKNGLFNNLLYIIIIWILGISIIGIPIVTIMFFIKSFTLGFSIASIVFNYKLKGCLLNFINIFPHQMIYFLIYMLITTYSIFFSLKMINSIINKKNMDFKIMMNKYVKILIISVIAITIGIIIETFITPLLIKIIIPLIK